jgi:hypothetical protein
MARRDAAAGHSRGGTGIQALRPARARLITAALALAVLAGADAYSVASAGRLAPVAAAGSVVGLGLLAGGIVLRWPTTIPWAILASGGGYLAGREGRAVVDGWAAVIGVALLLGAELATWSIEHDARIRTEPALLARRTATLAGLAGVAMLVNFLLLGTAAVSASAGVLLAAVGVAAAVAAVAVVLRLARSAT